MSRSRSSSPAASHSYEYVEGWGMNTGAHGRVLRPRSVEAIRAALSEASTVGRTVGLRGTGCSYGDASSNSQGLSLDLTHMNQILGFDASTGIADLEAGVTIEQLWKHILPQGYWPKVVSGTMFPTVAGAAAMNIHGKNNFRVGTFGDNVLEFDLVLPSGELRTCNREQNTDLFHAAIGGLGMLGCFSRLRLQTKRIHSGKVRVRGESVRNLAAMMTYFEAEKGRADYLVGWVDCFARGDGMGRGLIHDAEYLAEGEDSEPEQTMQVAYQQLPGSILGFPKGEVWRFLRLINTPFGMRLLNALKQQAGRVEGHQGWHEQSHAAFNFLLDFVPNWKFAYGRKPGHGLIQYQVFLPAEVAHDTLLEILGLCQRRGHVPFLGVFKRHRPDPFWMTHALDGWSMAMDFKVTPSGRMDLWQTCDRLTRLVLEAGGKFYFAKDSLMGHEAMVRAFPKAKREAFLALKQETDPGGLLETDLWRRIFTSSSSLTDGVA
ncbi:MAG: FAD-binding oxidoreductase [Planctomycetota bacterium]|nr:FAD-binding oxidoreductase [Planctomycetota bacterium]